MKPGEALLCDLLQGGGKAGSELSWPGDVEAFSHLAWLHGVLSLLDRQLGVMPGTSSCPQGIRNACREAAIAEAVNEVIQRGELVRVLEGFAEAGLKPLLLKGAALAFSHYPEASLRPRSDTDLLVPESSVAIAERALGGLGYLRNHGVSGHYIAYQACWSHIDRHGVSHLVDLHWKINNSQILARALDYQELAAQAIQVPSLGSNAFAPAPTHALLLACMHRAGHMLDSHYYDDASHPGGDRLIWLYDIHLLLSRMSAEEVGEFVSLAAKKRMKAICLDAFSHTSACFGTSIPVQILVGLKNNGPRESSERYLGDQPAFRMFGDFSAIDNFVGRVRWLRELVFPSPNYMRAQYADASVSWLPWLYIRRTAYGFWKHVLSRGSHNAR